VSLTNLLIWFLHLKSTEDGHKCKKGSSFSYLLQHQVEQHKNVSGLKADCKEMFSGFGAEKGSLKKLLFLLNEKKAEVKKGWSGKQHFYGIRCVSLRPLNQIEAQKNVPKSEEFE
jgi:hypothetical protein